MGEKLYLARKRKRRCQSEEASARAISVHSYHRMENDQVFHIPDTKIKKIELREECMILRRRKKMSVRDLAKASGFCPWWVTQMEQGDQPVDSLRDFWFANKKKRKKSKD